MEPPRPANLIDLEPEKRLIFYRDETSHGGDLKRHRRFIQGLILWAVLLGGASHAWAIGRLTLDTEGFLRSAEDARSDSSATFSYSTSFEDQGEVLEGKIDVKGLAYVSDYSSFTFTSKDAYVATSSRLMKRHQVTFGRRLYSWSLADDYWKSGMWSPRFTWDPFRPEQVGLTGLFYTYQSRKWNLRFFGSPVTVPERSYPVQERDGALVSESPFWKPLPAQLRTSTGNLLNVNYDLQQPSVSEMLFNPAVAASVRFGEKRGGFGSVAVGLMPMHQADLVVEPTLVADVDPYVATRVRPQFPMHRLATVEGGYIGKRFSAWASFTEEKPFDIYRAPNGIANRMGLTRMLVLGGQYRTSGGLVASGSFLTLNERPETPPSNPNLNVAVDLPKRHQYNQALRLDLSWRNTLPLSYLCSWTHDLENKGHLISFDIGYQKHWDSAWNIGLGVDLLSGDSGEGWIGQYNGYDRVRARLAYAF